MFDCKVTPPSDYVQDRMESCLKLSIIDSDDTFIKTNQLLADLDWELNIIWDAILNFGILKSHQLKLLSFIDQSYQKLLGTFSEVNSEPAQNGQFHAWFGAKITGKS